MFYTDSTFNDRLASLYRQLLRMWPEEVAEWYMIYEGSGDSGMIEYGCAHDAHGNEVLFKGLKYTGNEPMVLNDEPELKNEIVTIHEWDPATGGWVNRLGRKDIKLTEVLTDLASLVADGHAPGWENNEGGSGKVIITRTEVRVEHSQNILTTEYSEKTFEPQFSAMERLTNELEGA